MNVLRLRLRRLTWLAICAMLAMTLLPTVSHALARWGTPAWQSGLCGTQAVRSVTPGATGEGKDIRTERRRLPQLPQLPAGWSAWHFGHCPYCATAFAGIGPAPTSPAMALRADSAAAMPPPRTHAPQPLQAWASVQPRAPPAPI